MDGRHLIGAEQAQRAEPCAGDAVVERIVLRQREAERHGDAALDLPLAGERIDRLADEVRRVDLADRSVVVEHTHMGSVAVGDVADGIGNVLRAQRVGLGEVFAVELLPLERFPVHARPLRQLGADRAAAVAAGQRFHALPVRDAGIIGHPHIGARRREQLLTRPPAGFAGHERLARAGGRAGVRRVHRVGGLVDDILALTVQHGADDLRQHRAKSLSDAGCAGADMELTVLDRHDAAARIGNAHADARVLHRAGDADVLILLADVLHRLERFHKTGGRRRDLPVRQRLPGADGVAVADLPRGDAQLVCHLCERHFHGVAGLRHAEAAERARGRIVRIVRLAGDLKIFVVIGARRVRAGTLEHRAAERGIRAGVGDHLGLDALNESVAIAAHGDGHLHRVPLRVDEHTFLSAELHLDRTAREIGDERRVVLHRHILLAAEAAADEHIGHMDLFLGKPQQTGDLPRRVVSALIGGEDGQPVLVGIGDRALRLEEGVLRVRRFVMIHQHIVRVADGLIGVAAADVLFAQQVAGLMHERRKGLGGIGRAEHRLERLVVDLDERLCLLQSLLRLRRHKADGVAEVVGDPADGDHRVPVLLQMADLDLPRNVLRGVDADHAGQGLRLFLMDGKHPRAGVFAAHGAGVEHTVHIQIIRILAVALHLFRHVHAHSAFTDAIACLFLLRQLAAAEDLRREQNAVDDLHIARAAADVVADGERRLLARRRGIRVQQRLGGDDHARDAEAALHRAGLAEGVGIYVLLPVGKALDRKDGLSLQLVRRGNAGLRRLAVDEDMAGAARALAASVLDGGEAQLVAQEADELLIFLRLHGLSVHGKCRHSGVSLPKLFVWTAYYFSFSLYHIRPKLQQKDT